MNVKIGEKIKKLRQRDSRTQEELANAVGVSAQAVSRWESNGGYPDIELLPSIANYFSISIDELFGYSNEREAKINEIYERASSEIVAQGDMSECIKMLRSAIEEFPSEPRLYVLLEYALVLHGWHQHGARSYTKDGCDYALEDTEYNSQNEYWQEAVRIAEKLLKMDIPSDERDSCIMNLVVLNTKMGNGDKAKEIAFKQNMIITCRELLLPKATEGQEREKYLGEAIIVLLREMKQILMCFGTKLSFHSGEGLSQTVAFLDFCENVFCDGRCGEMHWHMGELYLCVATFEANNNNFDKASEYFKKGFWHIKQLQAARYTDEYRYTAPLVSNVTADRGQLLPVAPTFWDGWSESFPENFVKMLKKIPEYSEIFE